MSCRYRDLIAWQRAKALVGDVYRITESFPATEAYGLTSQLRRAAISVVSNIAEGQGRLSLGEFIHFLGQARGSLLELKPQLEIAMDMKYVTASRLAELELRTTEVQRLLNGLIASLRSRKAAANG
ncbi:MAG TPA: four helix bundle protein [Terriglobales bacterium]|nr:four helix bundle protein [Terriglobales bacterium]